MENVKKNITFDGFYKEVIELTRKDPIWEKYSHILDYYSEDALNDWKNLPIKSYQFDVVAHTVWGTSEGIYCDVYIQGDCGIEHRKSPISFATLKTLGTTQEDFLKISCLGNLFCFWANHFVSRNLQLFE